MASEEVKKFREMMELVQDSRRSFERFRDEARSIVLKTRSFANDTIEYSTDAQDDDLELQDKDELFEDWRDSNKRMEACIKKADTVKALYNASFEKLRAAQTKAKDGRVCGMEKKYESRKTAAMCGSGASALVCLSTLATAATGGLALPFTFLAGGCVLAGGTVWSMEDAEKHEEWEKEFTTAEWKLDKIYSLLKMQTDSIKKELIDLHQESSEILDKANRIANRSRISRDVRLCLPDSTRSLCQLILSLVCRSGCFKLKCRRLGQQSAGLKRGCDQYISHEDDFAITGLMSQLSIEN